MQYKPADVLMLTQLMIADVRRVASISNIKGLPDKSTSFSGKNPSDVFQKVLVTYVKLNALAGQTDITPSEVYAQTV